MKGLFDYQLLKKIICVSIILMIVLILSNTLYSYFTLGDDTYIYLQYAKSFIEHKELAFNHGIKSYGFTSPLWLFLIILLNKITGNLVVVPQLLSNLFSVLSIIIWYFIIKQRISNSKILFLFLFFVSVDPNLLKHSYLGMEASLSYFLSSAIVLILFDRKSRKNNLLLGFILGVYHLVRPESILIALLIVLFYYFIKKETLVEVSRIICVLLITIIPWYMFSVFYFGELLPGTFAAKGAAYTLGARFFEHIWDTIKIFGGNYFALIILVVFILIKYKVSLFFSYHKEIILITSMFFLLIIFYSLTISNELIYARYYCILFPFLMFLGLIAYQKITESTKYNYIIIISLSLLSVSTSVYFSEINSKLFLTGEKLEDNIISWVNENTKVGDKIVRGRIGKIGFETNRKIIDPIGLINPEITKYYKKGNVAEYYEKVKPNYFIGNYGDLFTSLSNVKKVEVVKTFSSHSRFLIRQYFSEKSKNEIIKIYKVTWL